MIKLNLGYPDNIIIPYKTKILFAVSEVAPLVKTGGLADVSAELPHALKNMGCDIRIVLPFYGSIPKDKFEIKPLNINIKIPTANSIFEEINLYETRIFNDIPVYLIKHDDYFKREGLYGSNKGDYSDNDKRFILFCRSVMEMIPHINFFPDIIHANDWQTGLIPLYLKNFYQYNKTHSVFTIHNLAYQGIFPHSSLEFAGLSDEYFNMDALEFYGKINFLKSGIIYSDMVTTVSEQYSKEIQTTEFGCGLDGLLRKKKQPLTGIINGIDYKIWDPAADNRIKSKYNEKNINGKKNCKSDLQNILQLPVNGEIPIIGMITRLTDQKGLDIVVEIFDDLMRIDLQFVLLGTGETKYHDIFNKYASFYTNKISVNLGFDSILAEKIYAGLDIFLMPSYFEPCGLGQLISMKFGTIPIVRNVGGLHDSVSNFNTDSLSGTGFIFNEYSGKELLLCIKHAIEIYQNKSKWQILIHNAMKKDFSWKNSAKKYLELYQNILLIPD